MEETMPKAEGYSTVREFFDDSDDEDRDVDVCCNHIFQS